MTEEADPALTREILSDAGAERIIVREIAPRHWQVACEWGSGATDETDETMDTPQEVAQHIIDHHNQKAAAGPSTATAAQSAGAGVQDAPSAAASPDVGSQGPVSADDLEQADEAQNDDDHYDTAEIDGDRGEGGQAFSDGDQNGTVDAEFEENAGFIEGADLDLPALEAPPEAELQPEEHPGGAFIFGDNLPRDRLVRIGQIDEIEVELLAALQEGWSIAEFASLQNAVQRMEAGLAPIDDVARARFTTISERSQAMSRIEAYSRDRKAFIRTANREEVEVFDPEAGWPS